VPGRDVRFVAETQKLPADKIDKFEAAADELLKSMPETAADSAAEKLVQQLADFLKKNPPEGSGSTK
jgi:hypothetical protein